MKKYAVIVLSGLLLFGCKSKDANDFTLRRIVFHTSPCFGSCPTLHMELENTRQLRVYAETVYNSQATGKDLFPYRDTTRMGYFTGQVSDSLYSELLNELRRVGIDTLTFNEKANCCDAPERTIIVYYNGKRKFLKSMFPPKEANRLISILENIWVLTPLTRSGEKFELETQ